MIDELASAQEGSNCRPSVQVISYLEHAKQQISCAPRCHDASFFDQLGLGPNAQLVPGFFAHGESTFAQAW